MKVALPSKSSRFDSISTQTSGVHKKGYQGMVLSPGTSILLVHNGTQSTITLCQPLFITSPL
eukprot:1146279-Pelagomonas_calceolata.AAC.3